MSQHKTDRAAWTRRDFMRITGGAMALGAFAHPSRLPAATAADSVSNLDDVIRQKTKRGQRIANCTKEVSLDLAIRSQKCRGRRPSRWDPR